jgi:hypothetical protein
MGVRNMDHPRTRSVSRVSRLIARAGRGKRQSLTPCAPTGSFVALPEDGVPEEAAVERANVCAALPALPVRTLKALVRGKPFDRAWRKREEKGSALQRGPGLLLERLTTPVA